MWDKIRCFDVRTESGAAFEGKMPVVGAGCGIKQVLHWIVQAYPIIKSFSEAAAFKTPFFISSGQGGKRPQTQTLVIIKDVHSLLEDIFTLTSYTAPPTAYIINSRRTGHDRKFELLTSSN
jgi:hypothetical protein